MSFAHLHVHSQYSLLDGAINIKELISHVKELGMTSVAITDHGAMYGVVDFYKEAKSQGIHPVIGCEVYTAARTRVDKTHEYDSEIGHLVLLAKNQTGYQNLIYIVSMASIEGFYYKPRVDMELLREHSEGIIALSACLAGEIPRAILNNDEAKARQTAEQYLEIFGKDNFYLEVQDHGIPEQQKVNKAIIKLAKETGIGLVATNDAHYIKKEDAYYQDVLMCIQMKKTVEDTDRMKFQTEEFYIKTEEEMRALFPEIPEAIENTQKIADMCNVEFDFNNQHLPKYDVPGNADPFEYLKMQCGAGLARKCPDKVSEYADRLNYELDTIKSMGYVDYFLIVWDFIKYAKDNKIMVGPGRGSAAGSLVSYVLDITDINPIDYNLIFERFLNPERVTMPDIDIDFCYERRQEVIEYVTRKYGADRVAQIITFGTLAAKAAIRDVGRVLDMPYAEVDAVAKQIPFELKMTIDKAVKSNSILRDMIENDPKIAQLIEVSKALEGSPRNISTHAAGVVISGEPVYEHVPLLKTEDGLVTEFTMTTLEELGLLKMDFLGLRTLTVIRDAVRMIEETTGDVVDIRNIDMNDKAVYDMISEGETSGVFQLESGGMRSFMRDLKPRGLEDIIAGISLYRPGPMDQIPRYVANKNNPDSITYAHPILENILDVTYGCMVYQEQVMQIVRDMAGYSWGRSDLVRRAMSKKKFEVMEKERKNFIHGIVAEDGTIEIEGALRRGVSEAVANKIFDEMMDFANYAFNKSHAAAYAVVAYQTAYLKCRYPACLLAALLSSTNDFVKYIAESRRMGIKLLPPDINKSGTAFTVSEGNIRFGLAAIKNVGTNVVESIIEERIRNGEFKSYKDFCVRIGDTVSKRVHEFMIKAGVFDSLGVNRKQLIESYESILDALSDNKKRNISGQVSLFGEEVGISDEEENYPDIAEYDLKTILKMEKDILGFYVSGHPLQEHLEKMKLVSDITTEDINLLLKPEEEQEEDLKLKDGQNVTVCGVLSKLSVKISKNGNRFAIAELEDLYGTVEVMIFSKVLDMSGTAIQQEGTPIIVKGKLDVDLDANRAVIISDEISLLQEAKLHKRLYLQMNSSSDTEKLDNVKEILKKNCGDEAVYLYFSDKRQLTCAPRNMWVEISDLMIAQLEKILGEENVKIK